MPTGCTPNREVCVFPRLTVADSAPLTECPSRDSTVTRNCTSMQRTRSGGAGCGHFSGTGGAGRRMLATAASAIAGGACVVGGCWTHWRCLGRPPASWKLARAAFGGSLRPPHEDGCAPAARHLAFASGAALSGFALMESAFGHVGLNVVDGLHPLLPTIVGSGLLVGITRRAG